MVWDGDAPMTGNGRDTSHCRVAAGQPTRAGAQRVTVATRFTATTFAKKNSPGGSVVARPTPYLAVLPTCPGTRRRTWSPRIRERPRPVPSPRQRKLGRLALLATPGRACPGRFDPDALVETAHGTRTGQAAAPDRLSGLARARPIRAGDDKPRGRPLKREARMPTRSPPVVAADPSALALPVPTRAGGRLARSRRRLQAPRSAAKQAACDTFDLFAQ